jgi:hypothetical protein
LGKVFCIGRHRDTDLLILKHVSALEKEDLAAKVDLSLFIKCDGEILDNPLYVIC